jgi:hypothetical protein
MRERTHNAGFAEVGRGDLDKAPAAVAQISPDHLRLPGLGAHLVVAMMVGRSCKGHAGLALTRG